MLKNYLYFYKKFFFFFKKKKFYVFIPFQTQSLKFFNFFKILNFFFFKFFKKNTFFKRLKKKKMFLVFKKLNYFIRLSRFNLVEYNSVLSGSYFKNLSILSFWFLVTHNIYNIYKLFFCSLNFLINKRIQFYCSGYELTTTINNLISRFSIIQVNINLHYILLVRWFFFFKKKYTRFLKFIFFKIRKKKFKFFRKQSFSNKFKVLFKQTYIFLNLFEINYLSSTVCTVLKFINVSFLVNLPLNFYHYRFYNWKKKNF